MVEIDDTRFTLVNGCARHPGASAGRNSSSFVIIIAGLAFAFQWPCFSYAQPIQMQDEIVVTVTRQPGLGVNAPASIDRIAIDAIRAGLPLIDASEVLNRVPGIVVQNRQNFAQDTQVSARGFGARASFGIRGLKLFVDDIPASIPDGQGQGAIIPLFVVDTIEVLRGPWAVPFGNAAGGVISAQSIAPSSMPRLESSFAAGGDQMRVMTWQASATNNSVGGRVAMQRFSSDGFRAHSQVEREQTYARLDIDFAAGHRLKFTGNLIHQPDTGDPLGLTRSQFDADARQAPTAAIVFNTRKSVDHQQLGAVYDGNAGMFSWKLLAYGGNREVEQFLSTPIAAQAPATNPGGVVALGRHFQGVGLKLSATQPTWSWTLGADVDSAREARQGYENFIRSGTSTTTGVRGRLRRDEINEQRAHDIYAYLEWTLSPLWKFHAALRSNRIEFDSTDRYVFADNADDSGARRYQRITPAAALVYRVNPTSNAYVSASSGFETPTAGELAYRTDRSAGLNFNLAASTNRQLEVGYKQRGEGTSINIAAFLITSYDEIVAATSNAGRTTFQNGGRTARRGLESSVDWQMFTSARGVPPISLRVAYTFLDAIFRDGYQVLDIGNRRIASGAAIPGIPRHRLFIEAAWRRGVPGFSAALEWQARSRIFADDTNSPLATAAGYAVVHARAAYSFSWNLRGAMLELQPFVRVENLLDRKYVSSVIVNEANQRYFESASSRRWLTGVNGVVRF